MSSHASGSQIHVDPDEVAAIGNFSKVNDRPVGGGEDPPHFGDR